jgi:hypothetical protein
VAGSRTEWGQGEDTNVQTEFIQPGWTLISRDGEELVPAMAVDATPFASRRAAILGGELTIPPSAITDVETGRVELSLTKPEATAIKS